MNIWYSLLHTQKRIISITRLGIIDIGLPHSRWSLAMTGLSITRHCEGVKRPWQSRKEMGFSLVEMLMALLVASLLLAALAPVMTRRLHGENLTIAGTGGALIPKVYCAYVNDGTEPKIVNDDKTGCVVPDNTYSMNVIMASGGGGGGGAADMAVADSEETLITKSGVSGASNSNTLTDTDNVKFFDKSTKSLTIRISGGGAGGSGGNYYNTGVAAPASQKDCEPFGVYIPSQYNGGKAICVSKYNPGENRDGSPPIPAKVGNLTIKSVAAGASCSDTTNNTATGTSCCWYGNNNSSYKTAASCDIANGSYSGCYRTVCQWQAANVICNNWKPLGDNGPSGRLATDIEVGKWHNNMTVVSNGKGTSGLQLCYETAGTGASICTRSNSCSGGSFCCIHCIWTGTKGSSTNTYIDWWANNNSVGGESQPYAEAKSVRCVIEETYSFTPQYGGGGSSGTFVEVKVPENIISLATANDRAKIVVRAGAGGKGGSGAKTGSTAKADKGIDGSPSWVGVYDDNTLLWALTVPGGKAGEGAQKQTAGTNGASVVEECVYYDSTNPSYNNPSGTKLSCSNVPGRISSFNGAANSTIGKGGLSNWTTQGSTSSIGKGGDGGYCTQNSAGDEVVCADAENGGGGTITALHKPTYPGIGGGGGAAGTVAHIRNIQVRPKDVVKVQTGHGGNGGSAGSKGNDGGSSYVEILREGAVISKYEVLGGGGGNPGVKGNPSKGEVAKAGTAGTGSKIASGTKIIDGEYYPTKADDTKGGDGVKSEDELTSSGGNGGINIKISPLAKTDGDLNGQPCGGLNAGEIKAGKETMFQCNNTSNIPLPLSRSLIDGNFTVDILNNFAPGSTGGGGGGWKYGANPAASGGAKGMGGYVYVYFGDWGE